MIVLGVTGSFDRVDERVWKTGIHDASATLIRDGEVVAAVEEERLNRYKHSGKMPLEAIRHCLDTAGITLDRVDRLVFNVLERDVDESLEAAYRANLVGGYRLGRPFIQQLLKREFGCTLDPGRFEFVDHHYAHAVSAFVPSGFPESLVVTLDGMGSGLSGSVWMGADGALTHLRNYDGLPRPTTQSLGHLYIAVTAFLGFRNFDEYKVMGLAPYGDRRRHRAVFDTLYALKPGGDYDVYLSRLDALTEICPPRRRQDPIAQVHMDIAAALQEALETLVFHILTFYREETGATRLCLSGGVAHNCAANGKILRDGLFEEAFVQPASHDGGLSLGAALHGYRPTGGAAPRRASPMTHAYLGPDCGDEAAIERELSQWSACIDYARSDRLSEQVAALMADGRIVGWIQGRAEFGPRALGNRSIVADPRPAGHKDLINAMIKKREAFRPFAPSVLEERADEYFELPRGQRQLPYMVFVVNVREPYRELLGAITHVDGTARIQTVSRVSNPAFWALIHAFGERTGVPIVLNTSFNNNAEPIVTSPRDGLVCFLTTGLDVLVVGPYIVTKKAADRRVYASFRPSLPAFGRLHQLRLRAATNGHHPGGPKDDPFFMRLFESLYDNDPDADYWIGNTHDARKASISAPMAALLAGADGYATFADLTRAQDVETQDRLLDELLDLWGRRVVCLFPTP